MTMKRFVLFPNAPDMRRRRSPVSSLEESLEIVRIVLRQRFNERASGRNKTNFEAFWKRVARWLEANETTASALSNMKSSAMSSFGPNIEDSLGIAAAYCIEAIDTLETSGNRESSWYALTRCYFYLGMASGPESPSELAGKGGKARGSAFNPLRDRILEWISELPESSFKSIDAIAQEIKPRYREFKAAKSLENMRKLDPGYKDRRKEAYGYPQDFLVLVRKLHTKDDAVRAAIHRAKISKKSRGRPKKAL